jgi:tRNA(Ile)-lysidine synthetase-like protein
VKAVEHVWGRIVRALAQPSARPSSGRLLIACSGGPDSSTLLDALHALAPELGLELSVACVDHGLRAEAAAEAQAVVARAQALGLAGVALRVELSGRSMAAARRARYGALIAYARTVGAEAIAVGHTATDQAETLLDRLLRGAGTRGLSAMAPVRAIAPGLLLVRPLLAVTSVEIEAYVAARGLTVVRDPTNGNRHYRRSRIRHDLLPLLRRERPDLDRALGELSDRLRADADALDAWAAEAHAKLCAEDGSLDAAGLAALPEGVAARVLLRTVGVELGRVHLAALRRLCADRRGTRSVDLPGGVTAERRYDRLRFGPRPVSLSTDASEVAVCGPGIYVLSGMAVDISSSLFAALGGGSLVLRHLRPGDRTRFGKVQDLLVNAKVPRPERGRLLLLARALDREVVWIDGVRLTGRSAVQ